MITQYIPWYQKCGIRAASQLVTPPLIKLDLLELPKQSILHYSTNSLVESGPVSDDFIFRNITRPIMVGHVIENGDIKGGPRRLAISSDGLIRTYHIKNRKFRLMKSIESADRDPSSLIVYNYGMIPKLFKYMRSYYSAYYKWWNINSAIWKKAGELSTTIERNQFILCTLPTILPSVSDLKLGSGVINQKSVKLFNTPESLMILELWKWFGENRSESILSNVPDAGLDKINLVFQESGFFFVMNLGRMNRWRVATKEELEINPDANIKGIGAKQIQLRFLRLMMTLFQVRTVTKETVVVSEKKVDSEIVKTEVILPDNDSAELKDIDLEIKHTDEDDSNIEKELSELETISKNHFGNMDDEGTVTHTPVIQESVTLEGGVMRVCDKLADLGLLSAAEYKRFDEMSKIYKTIKAPNGKETLDKFIEIKPESLVIQESHKFKDIPTVVDKTMLSSSLHDFDSRYIKTILQKDIASMATHIQNAGVIVTDYNVETVTDIMGDYNHYTMKIKPIEGMASTMRFRLPVLSDDGVFVSNGVKYRLRKQRGDVPIRKIAPDVVALTSYYGKTFVSRSGKKVNDYGQWLRNSIMAKGLDSEDNSIIKIYPTKVFDSEFNAPRSYTAIAMGFRGFTVNMNTNGKETTYVLSFDHTKRIELYGHDAIKAYEKNGSIIIGESTSDRTRGLGPLGTKILLVMGTDGELYTANNGELFDLCTLEELLSLDSEKAPLDHAELKVMGKEIPIGLILGYELGLSKLMKLLNVEPRRVPAGTRVNLESHEYSITFDDETLVFNKDDKKASIILSGFNEFHKAIRNYGVYDFDKPGVYLNILETTGASARYLREVDLQYQMFIDPITKDLLIEMKEPTTFHGLLIRSCEMLLTDQHPDELDPEFMRIKGYERMAGVVYNEIVRAIRGHNGRAGRDSKQIELNPYAVWMSLRQDPAVTIVNDINPIQNLKETEAVTYSGSGGRNSRSMTKSTRIYHKNDMGTMSESTVDSSDVAINTFTSADPQFTSLRGMSKRYEIGKTGATALLSTSALMAPCSDTDDPKRVNFVGIQQSHVVSCTGYTQSVVRTGYEQVLAQRTGDMFATAAEQPGKVIQISDTGIIIEYEDGERKGFELGRRYGDAAGLVIPHSLVTDMKEGQKFTTGDIICHNEGFFEKDLLNPGNVVLRSGITVRTALMESTATLDDCSAISSKTAELLSTKITKVKDVIVDFTQSVHNVVKVGTMLTSEDILCIVEDSVSTEANLLDKASLDTLRVLSAMTPQAKAKGVLERIEIYYHGDIEDMSESLKALINSTDKELAKRFKAIGKKPLQGKVDENFRVGGDALALDTIDIRFFITGTVSAGIGDKGVFANQMKTVFGGIFENPITTESGLDVGGIFGYKSINNRIVNSPLLIGTTTTLLDVIGKKAVALYNNK